MADQKFDPSKTPGSFSAPPADAPAQVTTPGSERPTASQIAQARANEQDLPVFAPKPMTVEQIRAFLGKDPSAVPLSPRDAAKRPPTIVLTDAQETSTVPKPIISSVKPPDQPLVSKLRRVLRPIVDQLKGGEMTGTHLGAIPDHAALERAATLAAATGSVLDQNAADRAGIDAGVMPVPEPATDDDAAANARGELTPALEPAQPWQRAASDTDTPSAGLPTPIADKNKQITGGFGLAMDAQYFALDGSEVGVGIDHMLGKLQKQIKDDMRFTISTTYPRVTARVIVEVSAYATDQSFQIARVAVDHNKTPLEVARERADEVCFVLVAEMREMTDAGESVLPPDKMRKEMGLARPHKQAIDMPGGHRSFVDIKS